jgi:MoxR-like ATPase
VGGDRPPVVASAGLLVGREDEAEFIEAFIDRIPTESGALLLEGEAGVGKTALLEVAASRAAAASVRVLPAPWLAVGT